MGPTKVGSDHGEDVEGAGVRVRQQATALRLAEGSQAGGTGLRGQLGDLVEAERASGEGECFHEAARWLRELVGGPAQGLGDAGVARRGVGPLARQVENVLDAVEPVEQRGADLQHQGDAAQTGKPSLDQRGVGGRQTRGATARQQQLPRRLLGQWAYGDERLGVDAEGPLAGDHEARALTHPVRDLASGVGGQLLEVVEHQGATHRDPRDLSNGIDDGARGLHCVADGDGQVVDRARQLEGHEGKAMAPRPGPGQGGLADASGADEGDDGAVLLLQPSPLSSSFAETGAPAS